MVIGAAVTAAVDYRSETELTKLTQVVDLIDRNCSKLDRPEGGALLHIASSHLEAPLLFDKVD